MGRRLFASVGLAVALLAVMPLTVAGAAARVPSSVRQCLNGGWRNLTDDHGQRFTNQGSCIRWKIQHPVSLIDVAGTYTGTQSFTFGTNGCNFVHQVFDASYTGSAAVGTVTLHIEGCVTDASPATYDGTFTLATSAGILSGTASGSVTFFDTEADYELTLGVTTSTGGLGGATGSLHVSQIWLGLPDTRIAGTVTTK